MLYIVNTVCQVRYIQKAIEKYAKITNRIIVSKKKLRIYELMSSGKN